jgi:hypothetical protein
MMNRKELGTKWYYLDRSMSRRFPDRPAKTLKQTQDRRRPGRDSNQSLSGLKPTALQLQPARRVHSFDLYFSGTG